MLGIYSSRPCLLTYDNYNDVVISKTDYSKELISVIQKISHFYKKELTSKITRNSRNRKTIILAMPRISTIKKELLGKELSILISTISHNFPDTYFFLKPHPRDLIQDLTFLDNFLSNNLQWEFIPPCFWTHPIETLAGSLNASLIISGYSTIGINEDLISPTRVLVFNFLSFNLPYYNPFAKLVMQKACTYSGESVQEALESISAFLISDKENIHRKKPLQPYSR